MHPNIEIKDHCKTNVKRLDRVKANDEQIKEEIKHINEHLEKDDVWLEDLDKHATALDNYLDKH